MNIGDRIRELRERRGLTQEEVGSHLNVNKATVQRYESGNIDIKRKTALLLAEVLQTTPAYIMGWEDEVVEPDTLTADEQQLLRDYRALSDQGKEYMRQTMVMALHTYKKDSAISDMEVAEEIG
ncbi:MAG: helix-turn-helix transcriptional regulator [Christensenellaceae bacterium]|jgi:repressor LexA|nr:helix-turn-helix transcriptional regulator [Christensenellaceae bacterium]